MSDSLVLPGYPQAFDLSPATATAPKTGDKIEDLWLSVLEGGRLLLLGCPLELTPCERSILDALIESYPSPLSPGEICRRCPALSPGSLPVHINAINRKASRIGGRRLINARRGVGYLINKYM